MDLSTLIDKYYQYNPSFFDEIYSYNPEFPTLAAFMQNELLGQLAGADSLDEFASGIFTDEEANFLFNELKSFL